MVMKFSCKLCCKPVANSHHATHCGNFNTWVHVQCNRINKQAYTFLQKSSAAWSCIVLTLSRRRSLSYRNQSIELQWNSMDWFLYAKDHRHKKVKCPEQIFPFSNISNEEHFETNQVKNKTQSFHQTLNSEMMTAKQYEPDETSVLVQVSPSPPFPLWWVNRINGWKEVNFYFLVISKTCVKLNRNSLNPVAMPDYNIEHTSTKSSNAKILLCVK